MTDHPLAPRWDAVLEKRGLTAVKLYLAPDNIGTGQNAKVRLFVSGLQDPQRDYVEGWIARKEAEAARLVEDRHRETLREAVRWARGFCREPRRRHGWRPRRNRRDRGWSVQHLLA
jgi:hypothetical protein